MIVNDAAGRASTLPPRTLSFAVLSHIGCHLRALYVTPNDETAHDALTQLLDRLAVALSDRDKTRTAEVRIGLLEAMPGLRKYACSLTHDADRADDLVQETLLKGWQHRSHYEPGTNLEGWLSTILRNSFFGRYRKRAWEVEDPDEALAARLSVPAEQEVRLELRDMQAALQRLPLEQRDALLLVAVDGMSSEDVAALTGCAVGTVKSRVWRARSKLAEMLA